MMNKKQIKDLINKIFFDIINFNYDYLNHNSLEDIDFYIIENDFIDIYNKIIKLKNNISKNINVKNIYSIDDKYDDCIYHLKNIYLNNNKEKKIKAFIFFDIFFQDIQNDLYKIEGVIINEKDYV